MNAGLERDLKLLKAETKRELVPELAEDLKRQILHELTGRDLTAQNGTNSALGLLRVKYKEELYNTFGVGTWAKVWDAARLLSCKAVGVEYMRQLLPSQDKRAAAIAEKILLLVLDARQHGEQAAKEG